MFLLFLKSKLHIFGRLFLGSGSLSFPLFGSLFSLLLLEKSIIFSLLSSGCGSLRFQQISFDLGFLINDSLSLCCSYIVFLLSFSSPGDSGISISLRLCKFFISLSLQNSISFDFLQSSLFIGELIKSFLFSHFLCLLLLGISDLNS